MMLMTKVYKECVSSNYKVSYDPDHDILRLNNKYVDSFSYEEVSQNFFIMVEDDTNEIFGAQVLNFLSDKSSLQIIQASGYHNLYKCIFLIYEKLQKQEK